MTQPEQLLRAEADTMEELLVHDLGRALTSKEQHSLDGFWKLLDQKTSLKNKVQKLKVLDQKDRDALQQFVNENQQSRTNVAGKEVIDKVLGLTKEFHEQELLAWEKKRQEYMSSQFQSRGIAVMKGQSGNISMDLDLVHIQQLVDKVSSDASIKADLNAMYDELLKLNQEQADIAGIEMKEIREMLALLQQEVESTSKGQVDAPSQAGVPLSEQAHVQVEMTVEVEQEVKKAQEKIGENLVGKRDSFSTKKKFVEAYFDEHPDVLDDKDVKRLLRDINKVHFETALHMFHAWFSSDSKDTITVEVLDKYDAKGIRQAYNYDPKGGRGRGEKKALVLLYTDFFVPLFENGVSADDENMRHHLFDLFQRKAQASQSYTEVVKTRAGFELIAKLVEEGKLTPEDAFLYDLLPDFNFDLDLLDKGFKHESVLAEEFRLAKGSLGLQHGKETGKDQLFMNIIDLLLEETENRYGKLYSPVIAAKLKELRKKGSISDLHERLYESNNEQVFRVLQQKLHDAGRHASLMLQYGPAYGELLEKEAEIKELDDQEDVIEAMLDNELRYEISKKASECYQKIIAQLKEQAAELEGDERAKMSDLIASIEANPDLAMKRLRVDMIGLVVSTLPESPAVGGIISFTREDINARISKSKIIDKVNLSFAPVKTQNGVGLFAGVSFGKNIPLHGNNLRKADHKLWYTFGVGATGGAYQGVDKKYNGFVLPSFFGKVGMDFQTNFRQIENSLDAKAANYLGFSFGASGLIKRGEELAPGYRSKNPIAYTATVNVLDIDKLQGLEQRRAALEEKFTTFSSVSDISNPDNIYKHLQSQFPKTSGETLLTESKRVYAYLRPFGKNRSNLEDSVKSQILGELAYQYALVGYDESLTVLEGNFHLSKVTGGVTHVGPFRLPQVNVIFTRYYDLEWATSEESHQALLERSKTGSAAVEIKEVLSEEDVAILNEMFQITEDQKRVQYRTISGKDLLYIPDALLADSGSGVNLSTYFSDLVFRDESSSGMGGNGFLIPMTLLGIQSLVFAETTQYHLIVGGKGLQIKDGPSALQVTPGDKTNYQPFSLDTYNEQLTSGIDFPSKEQIDEKLSGPTLSESVNSIGLEVVEVGDSQVVYRLDGTQSIVVEGGITVDTNTEGGKTILRVPKGFGELKLDVQRIGGRSTITKIAFIPGGEELRLSFETTETSEDGWSSPEALTPKFASEVSSELESYFTSPQSQKELMHLRYGGSGGTYTKFRKAIQSQDWDQAATLANGWKLSVASGFSFSGNAEKREDLRRLGVELCLVVLTMHKHYEQAEYSEVIQTLVDQSSFEEGYYKNGQITKTKLKEITEDIVSGEKSFEEYKDLYYGIISGAYTTDNVDRRNRYKTPEYQLYRMVAGVKYIHQMRETTFKKAVRQDSKFNGETLRSYFDAALANIENGPDTSTYTSQTIQGGVGLVFGYPHSATEVEEIFVRDLNIAKGALVSIDDISIKRGFLERLKDQDPDLLQAYVDEFNKKMKQHYPDYVDINATHFIDFVIDGKDPGYPVKIDAKFLAGYCDTCLNESIILQDILVSFPEETITPRSVSVPGELICEDGVRLYVGSTENEASLQQQKYGLFALLGNLKSENGTTTPSHEEDSPGVTDPTHEEVGGEPDVVFDGNNTQTKDTPTGRGGTPGGGTNPDQDPVISNGGTEYTGNNGNVRDPSTWGGDPNASFRGANATDHMLIDVPIHEAESEAVNARRKQKPGEQSKERRNKPPKEPKPKTKSKEKSPSEGNDLKNRQDTDEAQSSRDADVAPL